MHGPVAVEASKALRRGELYKKISEGAQLQLAIKTVFESLPVNELPSRKQLESVFRNAENLDPKTRNELETYAQGLIAHRKQYLVLQRQSVKPSTVFRAVFHSSLSEPASARVVKGKWGIILYVGKQDFEVAAKNQGVNLSSLAFSMSDKPIVVIDSSKFSGAEALSKVEYENSHQSFRPHEITSNLPPKRRKELSSARAVNFDMTDEFLANLVENNAGIMLRDHLVEKIPIFQYYFLRLAKRNFRGEKLNVFLERNLDLFRGSTIRNVRLVERILATGKIQIPELVAVIANIRDYHKIWRRLPELMRLRGIEI